MDFTVTVPFLVMPLHVNRQTVSTLEVPRAKRTLIEDGVPYVIAARQGKTRLELPGPRLLLAPAAERVKVRRETHSDRELAHGDKPSET